MDTPSGPTKRVGQGISIEKTITYMVCVFPSLIANGSADPQALGGPYVFRSPWEFILHAKWLIMGGPSNPARCECTYCSGMAQEIISHHLNKILPGVAAKITFPKAATQVPATHVQPSRDYRNGGRTLATQTETRCSHLCQETELCEHH